MTELAVSLAVTASCAHRDTVGVIGHDVDLAQEPVAVGRCIGVDDDLVENVFCKVLSVLSMATTRLR